MELKKKVEAVIEVGKKESLKDEAEQCMWNAKGLISTYLEYLKGDITIEEVFNGLENLYGDGAAEPVFMYDPDPHSIIVRPEDVADVIDLTDEDCTMIEDEYHEYRLGNQSYDDMIKTITQKLVATTVE